MPWSRYTRRGCNHYREYLLDNAKYDNHLQVKKLPLVPTYVVDIGAHIGTFSVLVKRTFPGSQTICCERCPENIPMLSKNIRGFGKVVQAAITYEVDLTLLNSVFPDCVSIGGSIVCHPDLLATIDKVRYWADTRPLARKTLENVISENKLERIDLLKLDCEDSELSILRNTTSLDKIRFIVGEWHGRNQFMDIVSTRFSTWNFRIFRDGELGLFWLENKVI